MKGFKGFNKGLICRGKQYAENTIYEEENAEICKNGMHFCENPFEVLNYYGFINDSGEYPEINEFAEVEALEKVHTDDNEKFCTTKLKIGAKIDIAGFVKAGVNFILSKVDKSSAATNTGDYSAATNTGEYSAATNTGYMSAATNTGYRSAATNTGDMSAATNTGKYSAATNTGKYSAATNTGYMSAATVEGKESVAIATGYKSKARGALGCWIACAEWDKNGEHIIAFKTHKVDGKRIKANTFYRLENGKFIEAEE